MCQSFTLNINIQVINIICDFAVFLIFFLTQCFDLITWSRNSQSRVTLLPPLVAPSPHPHIPQNLYILYKFVLCNIFQPTLSSFEASDSHIFIFWFVDPLPFQTVCKQLAELFPRNKQTWDVQGVIQINLKLGQHARNSQF